MPAAYMQRPIPRVAADMSFMVVPTATPTIAQDLVFSDGDLQRWGRRCRASRPEAPGSDDDHGSEASVGNSVKIPKPVGEPGRRPERGGFPLKQQLVSVERWEEKTYEEIQAAVRKAALATLNPSLSFKFQDKHRIDLICAKMVKKWSFLDQYEDNWPVKSILKIVLKYTSERARKDNKEAAEELEGA
ncbi:hypothetical protein PLEOSDRAFT_1085232 [Pleurotus ostreatus PC15]|uniref:Uncharacterized protein n=1 Tax=Pleurotus ostreatus (strain PC15) TaxID=1137138 RepID=A0A067NQH2_PLEO1|nr:hypothetical protein PLEOSDRAFT_1085232 [Pleurotus ostreatus PC15]